MNTFSHIYKEAFEGIRIRCGYYLGSYGESRILISFLDKTGSLEALSVTQDKLFGNLDSIWSSYTDYHLKWPVLIFDDVQGNVERVLLLSDIPVNESPNEYGLRFDYSNPSDITDALLEYNGEYLFLNPVGGANGFSLLIMWNYLLERQISLIGTQIGIDSFIKWVDKIEGFLQSFNLEMALEGLSISNTEHLHTKIGDDDHYSVYKSVIVPSPIANEDPYLRKLIGLNGKQLYEDSGYDTAFRLKMDAIPYLEERGIRIGPYSTKEVQEEKERIMANYSINQHRAALLYKEYCDYCKANDFKCSLQKQLIYYRDVLFNKYKMSVIERDIRHDRKIIMLIREYEMNNDIDILKSINTLLRANTKKSFWTPNIRSFWHKEEECEIE